MERPPAANRGAEVQGHHTAGAEVDDTPSLHIAVRSGVYRLDAAAVVAVIARRPDVDPSTVWPCIHCDQTAAWFATPLVWRCTGCDRDGTLFELQHHVLVTPALLNHYVSSQAVR
jgi:hypothetical protein